MKTIRNVGLTVLFVTAVVVSWSASAEPQAIQFNFGSLIYSGAVAPAYEPGYTEPGYYFTTEGVTVTNNGGLGKLLSRDGTTWNRMADAGTLSTLRFVNNDFCPSTMVAKLSFVDRNYVPVSNGSGGPWAPNSHVGVQATALMLNEAYGFTNPSTMIFSIYGLEPGTYDVYVLGATTSAENRLHSISMGTASSTWDGTLGFLDDGNFVANPDVRLVSAGALGSSTLTAAQCRDVDRWIPGQNYVVFPVTITSWNQYLVVTSYGHNAAMNGIQIVPIPEPATMSLLVLGGLALLRRRTVVG